jgi:hypothetical protein
MMFPEKNVLPGVHLCYGMGQPKGNIFVDQDPTIQLDFIVFVVSIIWPILDGSGKSNLIGNGDFLIVQNHAPHDERKSGPCQ